jgi:hypothetical protein
MASPRDLSLDQAPIARDPVGDDHRAHTTDRDPGAAAEAHLATRVPYDSPGRAEFRPGPRLPER